MYTVESSIYSTLYEIGLHMLPLTCCSAFRMLCRWLYAQHEYSLRLSPTVISAITSSSFINLLFYSQSCCTVSLIAEVLSSACVDTSVSQLSALLSLHRKLLLSQEERPSSMLRGVEDSLNSLSKVLGHQLPTPNSWLMDAVTVSLVMSLDGGHCISVVMPFALNVL